MAQRANLRTQILCPEYFCEQFPVLSKELLLLPCRFVHMLLKELYERTKREKEHIEGRFEDLKVFEGRILYYN